MTSPSDVQNVPDVWTLLQRADKEIGKLCDREANEEDVTSCQLAIQAALRERDRFVLVPKEPTNGMVDAAREAALHGTEVGLSIFYLEVKAAIAAAPKP